MRRNGSGRADGIDAAVRDALDRFLRALDHAYTGRIEKIAVFGSRARGDHAPDSDVDVAVVLLSMDGRRFDERMRLTDLAYEILVDTGVDIQAWPVTWSEWHGSSAHSNPDLLANMKRNAVEFAVCAAGLGPTFSGSDYVAVGDIFPDYVRRGDKVRIFGKLNWLSATVT